MRPIEFLALLKKFSIEPVASIKIKVFTGLFSPVIEVPALISVKKFKI
jgi:hypothetical protein